MFSLALAVVPACAGDQPPAPPSFEQFRDSLPRFEGSYTVEGDIAVHSDEALLAYYDDHVAPGARPDQVETKVHGLVVDLEDGSHNLVPSPTRHNMTYCVSNNFGSNKAFVRDLMEEAVVAWERTVRINYIYKPGEDGNCTSANNNVYFNVRLVPGTPDPGFLARAFFPDDPRSKREILVNGGHLSQLSDGTLLHELGHALGFRHEFNHPNYPKPSCKETTTGATFPAPYDSISVMHYTVGTSGGCVGTATEHEISRLDRMASQVLYGPPADRCSQAAKDTCWKRDAWCEEAYAVDGARSDLCRFPNVTSPSICASPERRGIWTPANHPFAQHWPTAVPAGASGACITQVNNLTCSAADAALCLLHGASCERAFSVSGQRKDLCRWYANGTPSTCAAPGIWTTRESGFAQVWPSAVGIWPPGASGACITQVDNLK